MTYKRLIEVDLPIRTISAHARREKSIRHGHISTLHIWWARRPLAACRAVLCAALWPDPADPECPPAFREAAARHVTAFARKAVSDLKLAESCSPAAFGRWNTLSRMSVGAGLVPAPVVSAPVQARDPGQAQGQPLLDLTDSNHLNVLRYALLDFIGDFANWDNSTVPAYLETSRALTQAAHEAMGGAPGARPLVVDPFAGGGAIPLEALRVGADAFASDLNPVAVLLNKVVLEYIPKYGNAKLQTTNDKGEPIILNGLAEMVRHWGNWIKEQAGKELAGFYPKDPDGSTPIAYLWARTIRCDGPACGAEVPLMRSLWLAKKGERSVALRLIPDAKHKRVDFEIIHKQNGKWVKQKDEGTLRGMKDEKANDSSFIIHPSSFDGTVKRGSATCPVCGYTTPVARVREQLKTRRGGANDARLFCVVTTKRTEQGRFYRLPVQRDLDAVKKAVEELERRKKEHKGPLSLVPDEEISLNEIRRISVPIYGMTTWGDLFTSRQTLALITLARLATEIGERMQRENDSRLATAVQTVLGLAVSRFSDICNALCMWETTKTQVRHVFTRQAIGMVWDFAEPYIFADAAGNYSVTLDTMIDVLERLIAVDIVGHVENVSATAHPLPAESAQAVVTDPPYYDAVPYAHISDFFYVWLRRSLNNAHPDLLKGPVVPKEAEIVVDRPHELSNSTHDIAFYERELTKAFAEGKRLIQKDGIGVIVFASKTTSSWEAILQAVIDAGWKITGSWPIDTEMETRVAAQGQARLGSSVHLVTRRRDNENGYHTVGDWRDVLAALPKRIHEWMPRLAREGVVGADAIFACLGPALEVFSQYDRVETAGGERITLRDYLEKVWAVVGREALNQIFMGADPTGFEEDGRLTALWLWTLSANAERGMMNEDSEEVEADDAEENPKSQNPKTPSGFALEYDTARKLAQGIGAHLEDLDRPGGVVAVKGDGARLLAVTERRRALFGKGTVEEAAQPKKRKGGGRQIAFAEIEQQVGSVTPAGDDPTGEGFKAGATTLDRIHQAMLLFGEGRGEALKRFLVDDGAGKNDHFWRLSQALSALYPTASQEKRWVDGVLARKKGLGL